MLSARFHRHDSELHVEVCYRRCRKGAIWTMRGSMKSVAPDDFVNVLLGRCGVACGGLLRTISYKKDSEERV